MNKADRTRPGHILSMITAGDIQDVYDTGTDHIRADGVPAWQDLPREERARLVEICEEMLLRTPDAGQEALQEMILENLNPPDGGNAGDGDRGEQPAGVARSGDRDGKYRFRFRIRPGARCLEALGVDDPGLAALAGPACIEVRATEEEGLRIFGKLFPGEEPRAGLRRMLEQDRVDLEEIMAEKLPRFAAEQSARTGRNLRPRELARIPLDRLERLLEACGMSLWENFEKKYEINERVLGHEQLAPEDLLEEAE